MPNVVPSQCQVSGKRASIVSSIAVILLVLLFSGPVVFPVLAVTLFVNPAIFDWIGMESLITLHIKVIQPDGYKNLVSQKDIEFANIFFYVHSASFIMWLAKFLSFTIFSVFLFCINSGRIESINLSHDEVMENLRSSWFMLFCLFGFILIVILFLFLLPIVMENGGLIPPNKIGIGVCVLFWVGLSLSSELFVVNLLSELSMKARARDMERDLL